MIPLNAIQNEYSGNNISRKTDWLKKENLCDFVQEITNLEKILKRE